MTTTLRPTEPLQRSGDGQRSRHYQVCVNGRTVGTVHLATRAESGSSVAVLEELHIDRQDRGRGRGAVAALAAEEVARTWGCTQIETTVPAASAGALGFAGALGYVERGRVMDKPVAGGAVVLPQGSTSRPLAPDEYGAWLVARKAEYARSWIERGVPAAEAHARSDRDHARYLADGTATEGMLLRVVEHGGAVVGSLWLSVRETTAFVLSVEVDAAYRGKGHGRTLMLLADSEAAQAGRDRIGLHVFAGNIPALRLYASLGYRPTRYSMYKSLA